MILSKRWNRVSLLVGLGLLLNASLIQKVRAQSVRELEEQILNSDSPAENSVEESSKDLIDDKTTSSSKSNFQVDVDVPEIEEEKESAFKDKDLKAIEDAIQGPKEIPHSHIMVVQRRYIRKENRHEIVPAMLGLQPADSFRKQVGFGFGYVYHLTEDFGLELLHVNLIRNLNSGLSKTIRESVGLETDRIEPVITLGGSMQWTPLHSKSGAYRSIHYFEGFFLGGGGMTRSEDTQSAMAMWGVGFRVYLTKFALFKAELRDYIDFKSSGTESRFNVVLGMGILLGSGK